MRSLNHNVEVMAHSGIREIVNLAIGLPEVIRLEIGYSFFADGRQMIKGPTRRCFPRE